MANTLAALGVGGASSFLAQATLLAQAKNYSGTGKWLDEIGSANFQFGSATASAYIGRESYGDEVGLVLPGTSGNYASTPDTATLDITGDITLVVKMAATDWTPSADSTAVAKYLSTGNQRGYALGVLTSGAPFLTTSSDGATVTGNSSSVSLGFTNGTTHWLAATLDVDNGSGQRVAKYWVSDDGTSWTLHDTVTTGATTSILNNTTSLTIGGLNNGTAGLFAGAYYHTQVYSGVRDFSGTPSGGTLVYDADFSAQTPSTTSFTEVASGLTVTVNASTGGSDTNDPLFLPYSTDLNPFGAGVDYVAFPGIAGNYVSTPDTAALDITGDIELIARISVVQWVSGGDRAIISKHGSASGDYGPYAWRVSNNGTMLLGLASNSTTFAAAASTVALSGALAKWVRVTADISGCTTRFYYSNETTTDPTAVTWTQLGSDVSGTTIASLNSSNNPVCVGTWNENGTSDIFNGSVSRALVYNGIGGTLVADFNPDGGTVNSTQTSLTGTGDGLTWTFNRASTGRKLSVVDEDKFLLGTDDYFTTPDNPDLEFGTGTDWSAVFVARRFDAGTVQQSVGLRKRDQTGTNEYGWEVRISGSTGSVFAVEKDSSGTSYNVTAPPTYSTLGSRAVITGVSSRSDSTIQAYNNTTAGTLETSVTARDTDTANVLEIGRRRVNSVDYFADCEVVSAAIFKGKALTADEVAQVVSELA